MKLMMIGVDHAPELYCYSRPTFEYCYWKSIAWTAGQKKHFIIGIWLFLGNVIISVLTLQTERATLR